MTPNKHGSGRSHSRPRRHAQQAWTLLEVLLVVVIIGVLLALALPRYHRLTEHARSSEAVVTLAAIRTGEALYLAQAGTFVDAPDLSSINTALNLDLASDQFEYEIAQASPDAFLAVATRKLPASQAGQEPLRIAMDHQGQITYYWPGQLTPGGGVVGPPLGPGTGGGGGIGGGGGLGGGGGGGSGGGLGSGTGGSSTGGGRRSGGGGSGVIEGGGVGVGTPPTDFTPPPQVPDGATAPTTFTYIARGQDVWTDWPDINFKNILGAFGVAELSQAFDIVTASGVSSIATDLERKGIAISFDPTYFGPLGLCQTAIACHVYYPNLLPPSEPLLPPQIVFNPVYLTEAPAILAAVLVHEGTHFQQYLDGSIHNFFAGNLTVIDIEFRAWWNQSVYWDSIRAQHLPIDTVLEQELEQAWLRAKQGESALRDYITPLYT